MSALVSFPEPFDAHAGITFGREFNRLLGSRSFTNKGNIVTYQFYDLPVKATDDGVKGNSNMPTGHLFGDGFIDTVSHMFSRQSHGEEGDLLISGAWNIFYYRSSVVFALYSSREKSWCVHASALARFEWPAGTRVFYPRQN